MSFSKKFPCKRVSRCFSCLLILLVRSGSRLMFDCSQVSSRSSRIASLPGLSLVPVG
jgi:hypothetical protein